jgi:hypothetical protein
MSSILQRMRTRRRTGQRLQWLSRRAHNDGLRRCIRTVTLEQLEDSQCPLLFSLLPLRSDGSTLNSVHEVFESIDEGRDRAPALIVSSQRWIDAVAASRKRAARRTERHRGDP